MNWITFFKDYRIDYKHKENGKVTCNCPLHHPRDIDQFLLVYNGGGTCWYCGRHNTIEIIQGYLQCTKNEAYTIQEHYKGEKSYYNAPIKVAPNEIILPGKSFTPLESKFITNRQLENVKDVYDLRSGGVFDYFKYRVVIPVYKNNTIVSARGRLIHDGKVKYLALKPEDEIISHKHTLFNEDFVIGNTIVVVEGEIDAMRFGHGAVATYGTEVTDQQLLLLSKYKNVILLFDNDGAGKKATERVGNGIALLTGNTISSILLPKPYKDVGELPQELIQELRKDIYG